MFQFESMGNCCWFCYDVGINDEHLCSLCFSQV